MDLISREDLRERMYHVAFEVDSELQKWDSGCWIRYKLFEKILDEMPTIRKSLVITKYIPRPQGKWKQVCWKSPIAREIELLFHYKCDNCDKEVRLDRIERYNYCPHCGADMRGREDPPLDFTEDIY